MDSYALTDIGRVRAVNQDCVYCNNSFSGIFKNLYIVADGMGGHKAGDFASQYAVETLSTLLEQVDTHTVLSSLYTCIERMNEMLITKAAESEETEGAGTTLVATTITDDVATVANIGDSRAYLFSHGTLVQITKDHSLVESRVECGMISREEARFHPQKNLITKAIGISTTVEPDLFEVPVRKGDMILMCSDGLTNMISDDELRDMLADGIEDPCKDICERMVLTANQYGGTDNISALIVRV